MPQTKSNEAASLFERPRAELANDRDLRVAILYGSPVSGRMRPDSDVEVAVLYNRPLTADEKIELMGRLQDRLNQPVDLIDLATAGTTVGRASLHALRPRTGRQGCLYSAPRAPNMIAKGEALGFIRTLLSSRALEGRNVVFRTAGY